MTIDFSQIGKVIVDMRDYVASMLDDFEPMQHLRTTDISPTPAEADLFDIGNGMPLDKRMAEQFHTTVAKGTVPMQESSPRHSSRHCLPMHACERTPLGSIAANWCA